MSISSFFQITYLSSQYQAQIVDEDILLYYKNGGLYKMLSLKEFTVTLQKN